MARKANKVQETSLPFVGFMPRNEPLDAQPIYVAAKSYQELLSIALEDDHAAAIIMATFTSIAEATSFNVQDFIRRTGLGRDPLEAPGCPRANGSLFSREADQSVGSKQLQWRGGISAHQDGMI